MNSPIPPHSEYSQVARSSKLDRTAEPFLPTPDQILGPFYPLNSSANGTEDLAETPGRAGRASGELIQVSGKVLTRNERPIPGARIEVWQANAAGRYRHPSDATSSRLDPNFDGFAVLRTDDEGRYGFRTVKPGGYATPHGDTRPPHIHFLVDFGTTRLITQMYFAGEPGNLSDRWLQAAPNRNLLVVHLKNSTSGKKLFSKTAIFNIVLQID